MSDDDFFLGDKSADFVSR